MAEGQGGATARLQLSQGHLRLDYDTPKGEGYIWLRKALERDLPERYALRFDLRASAPDADFEIRLTDPARRDVWAWRRFDYHWPAVFQTLSIPSRSLEFAWGQSTAALTRAGSLEWLITPGQAGQGRIEFSDVTIETKPRLADPARQPAIRATSLLPDHPPGLAIDASNTTFWRGGKGRRPEALTLDFGGHREFGGLVLDWCPEDYATAYQLRTSADGKTWQPLKRLEGRRGGRDTLYLPDNESRYLQLFLLNSARSRGFCLREIAVLPVADTATPNAFFTRLARQAPPGDYPKYFLGQQSYFTIIGAPDSPQEGLLSEEGRLETGRGGPSLEPFLFRDGKLVTWSAVRPEQSLARGDLPIPTVTWQDREVRLHITAYATGGAEQALFARYRVENTGPRPVSLKLFIALRPFQVNPPWQSLNMAGGFSPLRNLEWRSGSLRVNDRLAVVPLTAPAGIGAMAFDQGELVDRLRQGSLPKTTSARDADGLTAAALVYPMTLSASGVKVVELAMPQTDPEHLLKRPAGKEGADRLPQVTAEWERQLAGPEFTGPPAAQRFIAALRTNLAYLLINRDAPAFYPGSRTYARAWIRDGAVMASALLGMGRTAEVRDFIDWYAEYQRPDGTIPCCIDRRGADAQIEHDSHGEFIYLIAEYYRYTRDDAFLRRLWPRVQRAVAAIDGLRQQRRTADYQTGPRSIFYGLMPESISHEGYAGNPVHAFWDGFWTLRGLKDAVDLAQALGDEAAIGAYTRLRDDFRHDLYAALNRTLIEKRIAYLPGSVELGDYDVNATAISINIAGEEAQLPAAPLRRTFDDYWTTVQQRRAGQLAWDTYTPYEVRSVEAFVRLGQRERALGLLDFLMTGQRPPAWHHWAEIVWRDPAAPKFIGDMPHSWIGAEFIRAVRSFYVFERERDQALVLAAGIPGDWLKTGADIGGRGLPTEYGKLSYGLRQSAPGELRLSLSGTVRPPPGGIIIQPPLPRPLTSVTVNGQPLTRFTADAARIDAVPAEVVLRY